MEKDLSLIEISGEDDSLLSLQHSPIVSNDTPYFSCSPLLQIPRSTPSFNPTPSSSYSTEIIKDEKDTSKPTSSSSEDINKENVNANKPEAPKLNVEPQQMKRKKKGGGFNLRKSLAWDRAFFTEEGVLDPLELSMLSGNTLSVIHEGRESLASELDGPSVSPGLKALEHNLFKELPSSARNQGSKVAGKTSPKLVHSAKEKMHPASPQNMKGMKFTTMTKTSPRAKRKVLSAQDINRSASKRNGCPLPVASSSLKRASNTNATNVTTKEPRISKQLATKNESPGVSTISRSSLTSSSHRKRNFTSQPATGQKNIGIKGMSSSASRSRNETKSGAAGKLIKKSTAQPGRSMVSLANNSSGGLSDAVVPAAAHPLNGHDSTSRKNVVSLPQTTCCYGGNMQQAQTQIAKPSGLRMPSPSLGFFGQSKSSNSQSELQRGPQPCDPTQASIPNVSKAGVLNSIQRRPPRPSRTIPTCSGTVQSVASPATNAASYGIIKSESELSDIKKVALLLQVNSESCATANSGQQLHDVDLKPPDDGEPFEKVKKISCIENIGLQINDIKLPQQNGPCEQLEKGDGKNAVDFCPRSRDSTGTGLDLLHCVSPLRLLVEVEARTSMNNSLNKNGSEVHGEQLNGLDEFERSPQQSELKKHGTWRVDPVSEMQSQRLNETLMEDCRSSKKGDKDYILKAADNVLEVQDCGAVSCSPAHRTETEHTKIETNGTDCLNGGSHVAEMVSVESTLLVGSCTSVTKTSADSDWMIFNSPSAKSAEQTETLKSCVITEQLSQNNCEQPSKGGLEHGKFSEGCPKTKDTLTEQPVEDRKRKPAPKSYSVSPESPTTNKNNNLYENSSEVHEEQLSGLDEFELSPQQTKLKKPNTCRVDPISDMKRQRLNGTLMGDCRSPEKGDKDYISNAADYILEVQDCSAVSYCPTHSAEAEPTEDETSETECLNGGLHVEEVNMLSSEATLLVGCCKSLTDNPAEDSNWMGLGSPSAKSAEQTEILSSCFLIEQVPQNDCEPPSKGHLQHGKCSEESQEENAFTACVDNEPVVRNVRHNVEDDALAFETVYKSDIIGEITTNNIVAEKYCRNIGGGIGSKLENSNVVSQIIPRQVDAASGMNNMNLRGVIDKQSDPSKKNFIFSDLLPEASYSPEKETVVLHSDCPTDMHDMREHDAEQAKLISPCSNKIELVYDDTLGEENGSIEDVSCIGGCGSEISHIPRKIDEVAGIDNSTRERFNEDALVHFIAESSLADSSNCNIKYSLENKRSLLGIDDKSRELKQDRVLQNLDLVIEQVPQENDGPCLGDNLLLINDSVESQGKETVEDVPLESDSFSADANVDRKVEYQSTKPSSDNIECFQDCDDSSDNQSCPLNLGSPSNSEGYQILSVANDESKSCSSNEKTNGTSNGSIKQNVHEPNNTILPLEGEINIHQSNGSFESELQDGLHSDVHPEEVKDAIVSFNKSVEDKKEGAPKIELPPNAVPFSDEWLAALEAAGEEILARKGGAVQNSPTDKSLPEPSPWSPVKRKNNQGLGPFDCTKFTNPADPSSTSN